MTGKRLGILIVDDDPDIQLLIAEVLEVLGREIFTASDSEEAQRLFLEHEIGLVVTDLKIPIIDGAKLLSWCHSQNKSIASVLLSSDRLELDRVTISSMNLLKPFLGESLLALKDFAQSVFDEMEG